MLKNIQKKIETKDLLIDNNSCDYIVIIDKNQIFKYFLLNNPT